MSVEIPFVPEYSWVRGANGYDLSVEINSIANDPPRNLLEEFVARR